MAIGVGAARYRDLNSDLPVCISQVPSHIQTVTGLQYTYLHAYNHTNGKSGDATADHSPRPIASYLELCDTHALHLVRSLSLTCFFAFLFFFCSGGFLDGRGALKEMDTPNSGWLIGRVGGVTSFSFAEEIE